MAEVLEFKLKSTDSPLSIRLKTPCQKCSHWIGHHLGSGCQMTKCECRVTKQQELDRLQIWADLKKTGGF